MTTKSKQQPPPDDKTNNNTKEKEKEQGKAVMLPNHINGPFMPYRELKGGLRLETITLRPDHPPQISIPVTISAGIKPLLRRICKKEPFKPCMCTFIMGIYMI